MLKQVVVEGRWEESVDMDTVTHNADVQSSKWLCLQPYIGLFLVHVVETSHD